MRLAGEGGALRHGYHVAAQIQTWALDYDVSVGSGTVTMTVGTTDTFRLTQTPLTLTLELPGRLWLWQAVTEAGARTYRVTGPPESVRVRRIG